MKICAEFEEQATALAAHKALVDDGIDPNDIEIRSPYPLAEEPIPPHRSMPMLMRSVVRVMWAMGLSFGFIFVCWTQLEWGPTAMTNGHPLIAPPLAMVITYECGMVTAILTTTFMFFLETFRYRQLVPPLEEDMPVAIGHVVVIVAGKSVEKAKQIFEGKGAKSVVQYGLVALLLASGLLNTGCARYNMREQDVVKPTERSEEFPPHHSRRMLNAEEASVPAPGPFQGLYYGDVKTFDELMATTARFSNLNYFYFKARSDKNEAEQKKYEDEKKPVQEQMGKIREVLTAEQGMPKLWQLKEANSVPPEMAGWKNPLEANEANLKAGETLYNVNCAMCHGPAGDGKGKVGELTYIPPPAIGTALYQSKDDSYIYYYIATGKNLMPTFGYKLTSKEICEIILHLRKLQGK